MTPECAEAAMLNQPSQPGKKEHFCVALIPDLPSDVIAADENVIRLEDLVTLDIPIGKVIRFAFCSVGFRSPIQVYRSVKGYAAGYAWVDEPVSTGHTLITALDAARFLEIKIAEKLRLS